MEVKSEVSSRELMNQLVARAALEAIQALKSNATTDNLLLRELKAIHSNTTLEDLPDHVQKAILTVASGMFGYMNRNGFVLVPKDSVKR